MAGQARAYRGRAAVWQVMRRPQLMRCRAGRASARKLVLDAVLAGQMAGADRDEHGAGLLQAAERSIAAQRAFRSLNSIL